MMDYDILLHFQRQKIKRQDMINVEKIRELLTSDSESDVKLGLQIMANRDHTSAFRDHKPELWFDGRKDVVCDWVYFLGNKLYRASSFVHFHERDVAIGSAPDWWIVEERTGKVIEKHDVIDLYEGYSLTHDVEIHLTFWDKIKVLFGINFRIEVKCSTTTFATVSQGRTKIILGKPKRMVHQMESFDQSGMMGGPQS